MQLDSRTARIVVANELRKDWERLKADCHAARLPSPRMQPGGLPDSVEVSVPGHTKRMSKDVGNAINLVNTWVRGYAAGYDAASRDDEEPESSDCPVAEAAILAKRVLDINGEGGPDDHELLAKAVLQLTVALLEGK